MALLREQVLEQIDALLAEFQRAQAATHYEDLPGDSDDDLGAIATRGPVALSS